MIVARIRVYDVAHRMVPVIGKQEAIPGRNAPGATQGNMTPRHSFSCMHLNPLLRILKSGFVRDEGGPLLTLPRLEFMCYKNHKIPWARIFVCVCVCVFESSPVFAELIQF